MPETSLPIRSTSGNKILIEPTEIKGEGGPEYPRLIIPVRLNLTPVREPQGIARSFVILDLQCGLGIVLPNRVLKIADGVAARNLHRIMFQTDATYLIEFPLDAYRLMKIEEHRPGDLSLRADFRFYIGLFSQSEGRHTTEARPQEFLAEFEAPSAQIDIVIPQSHWVGKILPGLGYGKRLIVELPVPEQGLVNGLAESLSELAHARRYFDSGDYDKAVEHCRNAIEPVRDEISELKKMIESETEYEWMKEIAVGTYDWLDGIRRKMRDLASKPHHLPSIGHFSRQDAETILLVTTAVVTYAARLAVQPEVSS